MIQLLRNTAFKSAPNDLHLIYVSPKWLFVTTYKVDPYFRITVTARQPQACIIRDRSHLYYQQDFDKACLFPAPADI